MTIEPRGQETAVERARRMAEEALRGDGATSVDPAVRDARRGRLAAREQLKSLPVDSPARVTRAFSYVLDDMIRVPGTQLRFGVDPLLSIIPGAGSTVGAAFGAVVLVDAIRLRAPLSVVFRMLGNYVIDWLVGLVPVLGTFFDMAYRSNRKNVRLLTRTIADREQVRKASVGYWLGVVGAVVLTLAVVIGLTVALLFAINDAITPG